MTFNVKTGLKYAFVTAIVGIGSGVSSHIVGKIDNNHDYPKKYPQLSAAQVDKLSMERDINIGVAFALGYVFYGALGLGRLEDLGLSRPKKENDGKPQGPSAP